MKKITTLILIFILFSCSKNNTNKIVNSAFQVSSKTAFVGEEIYLKSNSDEELNHQYFYKKNDVKNIVSYNRNAKILFDESGTYTLFLEVSNNAGKNKFSSVTINVKPKENGNMLTSDISSDVLDSLDYNNESF